MQKAAFRIYAELKDLIPKKWRVAPFAHTVHPHQSIKHILESMGIPHTEVDLILVNGEPVDFSCRIKDGDWVSVYPVFETFNITPINLLRPEPLRKTKFILDTHLGKLAAHLRMLGFDTRYHNDLEDEDLAKISRNEKRILLTRDRGLLKRNMVTHGCLVRESNPARQLREILQRFQLSNDINPFTRCLRCNGLLHETGRVQLKGQLQPRTSLYFNTFSQCEQCGQIYWQGSHYQQMKKFIENLTNPSSSQP